MAKRSEKLINRVAYLTCSMMDYRAKVEKLLEEGKMNVRGETYMKYCNMERRKLIKLGVDPIFLVNPYCGTDGQEL